MVSVILECVRLVQTRSTHNYVQSSEHQYTLVFPTTRKIIDREIKRRERDNGKSKRKELGLVYWCSCDKHANHIRSDRSTGKYNNTKHTKMVRCALIPLL